MDESEKMVRRMLRDVAEYVKDKDHFTIASDSDADYRTVVKEELPFADLKRYVGEDLKAHSKNLEQAKAMATVDSEFELIDYTDTEAFGDIFVKQQKNGNYVVRACDPLFAVNQKCMKLRASISRMRRDFWGYTRKMENLQHHLWLFIANHNGYELPTKRRVSGEPEKEIPAPPARLNVNLGL